MKTDGPSKRCCQVFSVYHPNDIKAEITMVNNTKEQDNTVDDDSSLINYYYTHKDQVMSILLNCTWVIVMGKHFNEKEQSLLLFWSMIYSKCWTENIQPILSNLLNSQLVGQIIWP